MWDYGRENEDRLVLIVNLETDFPKSYLERFHQLIDGLVGENQGFCRLLYGWIHGTGDEKLFVLHKINNVRVVGNRVNGGIRDMPLSRASHGDFRWPLQIESWWPLGICPLPCLKRHPIDENIVGIGI